MKLDVDIVVPEFRFEIENPTAVVEAMTAEVEKSVIARAKAGIGSRGPLPAPKDAGSDRNPGGKAYRRTGTLVDSIGSVVRDRRGEPVGVVRPFGDRPANENVAKKKDRAKQKTAAARLAAIEEATRDERAGVKPKLKRGRDGKFKAGKIRLRTADKNASLAGILSQPPKDKRAAAGDRAEYRVFEATGDEEAKAQRAAERVMKPRLVRG